MFAYRVGFPGWKIAARLGFRLSIKISVLYDKEAGVFVALSDDFNPQAGLAAESPTWDGLLKEVYYQIDEAMDFVFKKPVHDSIKPFFVEAPA